jgi:hypothetical protein
VKGRYIVGVLSHFPSSIVDCRTKYKRGLSHRRFSLSSFPDENMKTVCDGLTGRESRKRLYVSRLFYDVGLRRTYRAKKKTPLIFSFYIQHDGCHSKEEIDLRDCSTGWNNACRRNDLVYRRLWRLGFEGCGLLV